jgi:hypothetical protein
MGQQVNPQAAFMARQFEQGRLPGDPGMNLQTVLSMLSPSATNEFQDQFAGPPQVQDVFGLSPDETGAFIRQQLGLDLTPLQEMTGQQGTLDTISEYMKALAAQETAAAATTTAETRVTEAQVKVDAEKRLREEFETMSPEEQTQLFDTNLKSMALNGMTIYGEQVDRGTQQNAYRLVLGESAMPGLTALIKSLADNGEWEEAGRLVGLPAGVIQEKWWVGPKIGEIPPGTFQQGPAPTGAPQQAGDPTDDAVNAWMEGMADVLERWQSGQTQQ